MATIREEILDEIAVYVTAVKIAETTFGRLAVDDGKFVGRLRTGKRIGIDLVERARAYMRDNPPAAKSAA